MRSMTRWALTCPAVIVSVGLFARSVASVPSPIDTSWSVLSVNVCGVHVPSCTYQFRAVTLVPNCTTPLAPGWSTYVVGSVGAAPLPVSLTVTVGTATPAAVVPAGALAERSPSTHTTNAVA